MAKKQSVNRTKYHIMVSTPYGWVRLMETSYLDLNQVMNLDNATEQLTKEAENRRNTRKAAKVAKAVEAPVVPVVTETANVTQPTKTVKLKR